MGTKPLRLLGLAQRAGKLVCGMDAVKLMALRAHLFLLSNDAGGSTRRAAEKLTRDCRKPLIVTPYTKEEIGRAVGKRTCALLSVTDEDFSQGIKEAL